MAGGARFRLRHHARRVSARVRGNTRLSLFGVPSFFIPPSTSRRSTTPHTKRSSMSQAPTVPFAAVASAQELELLAEVRVDGGNASEIARRILRRLPAEPGRRSHAVWLPILLFTRGTKVPRTKVPRAAAFVLTLNFIETKRCVAGKQRIASQNGITTAKPTSLKARRPCSVPDPRVPWSPDSTHVTQGR